MMKPFSLLVFLFFDFLNLHAIEVKKSFFRLDDRESSELIWNTNEGTLLPPIHVRNYDDGSGFKSLDIDPGDGRHGHFNPTTYKSFSENLDLTNAIIKVNTETYPVLYFQSFILEGGWQIRPTGSRPLVIKVQGNMVINGVIDCSGEDGESLSTNVNNIAKGGRGVCSGGDGGDGGSVARSPTSGKKGGLNVSGGTAGPTTDLAMGQGGGGGGAYGDVGGGKNPKDGDDSMGSSGGNKGIHLSDDAFNEKGAGSGGGGGSAFVTNTDKDSSGGSGGAGGGVIDIVALGNVTIGVNGKILAYGGSGGGDATGLRAGGGGGGGGGSISLFAAGDIVNDGLIDANLGSGGVTSAIDGGDGGDGGNGRTWISDKFVPTGIGTINPPSFLFVAGVVRYKIGQFFAISRVLDLMNSKPQFTSASLLSSLQGFSSVTVEVSLSDQWDFEPILWQEVSNLTQKPARYFRYRVTINNQDATIPSQVTGLSFTYDPFVQDDFNFVGGCGKIKNPKRIDYDQFAFVFFILLLPILLVWRLYSEHVNAK